MKDIESQLFTEFRSVVGFSQSLMVLCQSPEEVQQDVTSIATQACCMWLLVAR